MYRCVVVGTDGSSTADQAVQLAAALARDWNAALHIVTAYRVGRSGTGAASAGPIGEGGVRGELQRGAAEEVIKKAAASWGEGINTEAHLVDKPSADAIVDTAQAVSADLIVVGSKGMHGARRVLGSVPNSVAHGANCAVLIVKTD
jgi:nucleotide-binding universal stress UspA family protein